MTHADKNTNRAVSKVEAAKGDTLSLPYMSVSLQYLNSDEVAKMLGVNVSTVKRWTEQGKLMCNKTAGGHRKFLMSDMVDFLERNRSQNPRIDAFPIETAEDLQVSYAILKRDHEFLAGYLYEQALSCRRERVQRVLNGLYLGQNLLHEIYDHILTPVLHSIGSAWLSGAISIAEEHLATQSIRDAIIRLQGIIRIPAEKQDRVLILNLSNDLHDLALKMVDHILEERGFHVFFSGQITSLENIERVFSKFMPDRVYLGSTYISDMQSTREEVTRLLDICANHQVDVFVGGRGFDTLRIQHDSIKGRMQNFAAVYKS